MTMPADNTPAIEAERLLPCPFCGADPLVNIIEPHSHGLRIGDWKMPDHEGSCVIECGCGAGLIDDTQAKVTARWNRRAPPAQAPEAVPLALSDLQDRLEAVAEAVRDDDHRGALAILKTTLRHLRSAPSPPSSAAPEAVALTERIEAAIEALDDNDGGAAMAILRETLRVLAARSSAPGSAAKGCA